MRTVSNFLPKLALAAAAGLCLAGAAQAQSGSALYELTRTGPAIAPDSEGSWRNSLGQLRLAPATHLRAGEPGTGLSLEAGATWFARVGVGGSSVAAQPGQAASAAQSLSLGGGYRFRDSQTLSLELVRDSRQQRLGLALSYDWPRYFVRLAYEPPFSPAPSEGLRLSAGVRF